MTFLTPINVRAAISFLVIAGFFQIMGGLMGWITVQGVGGWYQGLKRSPLNPPDYLFGIVWTALYFALSFAFWRIWSKPASKDRTIILWLFAGHMALNWLWTPVFFTLHAVFPALIMIYALIFTAAMLAWLCWAQDRAAAAVFVPYIAWLWFAGHLTHYILMKN